MESINDRLKIIDTHVHAGMYAGSFINTSYEDKLFGFFKNNGICKVIFTHNSFFVDLAKGLENTIKVTSDYPGIAYGYLVYNPHQIKKSIDIIEKNYGSGNIAGVKMHPEDHLCFITDKKYCPLWEIAQEKGIPVLSHTWNPNVASKAQKYADALLFEKVIEKYPGLKIILGHAGAKDYYYFEVTKMLKRCNSSSIYMDIAGDILYRGMLEHLVREIGSSRILFGSDAPWTDPSFTISYVLGACIGEQDRQNIFFGNAARLFNF